MSAIPARGSMMRRDTIDKSRSEKDMDYLPPPNPYAPILPSETLGLGQQPTDGPSWRQWLTTVAIILLIVGAIFAGLYFVG